jgi:hypothetical protein
MQIPSLPLNNATNIQDNDIVTENDNAFYPTIADNWFVARPYGFRISFADGKSVVCFLPISPSNLSVTTHFATNLIPTLYGTVEEHSDVRYFDIAIEGTTGMAPKYVGVFKEQVGPPKPGGDGGSAVVEAAENLNFGRQSFSITKSIPLGGFFSKTLGALSAIKNNALDLLGGNENISGISASQTGYTAFHTLYKMLLRHKKDAAGVPVSGGTSPGALLAAAASVAGIKQERKVHPIVFFNYKDGNQYNVVIRNFTMRRSADNPMLYYYSISMRGYALTGLKGKPEIDNQAQRLRELGLDGVSGSSLLGTIKKKANSAKGILGAAAGGINVLGS